MHLGFGLNSTPKIMNAILQKVLSLDRKISNGTDNYLDDILVNEDMVWADEVAVHLANYGLRRKEAEKVADGTKLLGLWVESSTNGGQLIGHHPVAGWLHVACGYIKRSNEGRRWENDIGKEARQMLLEVTQEIEMADPVGGKWSVVSKKGRVWCDASSLAVGCALEVDNGIVEDGGFQNS